MVGSVIVLSLLAVPLKTEKGMHEQNIFRDQKNESVVFRLQNAYVFIAD